MLRVLLLQNPLVRLVVDGLETFPERQANFLELGRACDQYDHARAMVFFLKPPSAVTPADERGRIRWDSAEGNDFRSTTFMQRMKDKRILKHAGLIKPMALGGSTAISYDPLRDIWALL